jgi:uncharacterized LabA/DUF88 family protein
MTTIKKGIPCANPKSLPQEFSVFEEKGSDVNLAIRLVRDASIGAMDHAIVVSNDSDITEAIRMAVSDCGARVTVLSPCVKVNFSLRNVSSHAEILDLKHLKKCQLPDVVTTPAGVTVSRPAAWTVQRTN